MYEDRLRNWRSPSGSGRAYIDEGEIYKGRIKKLKDKLSLLERSPEQYFYQANWDLQNKKVKPAGYFDPRTGRYIPSGAIIPIK